MGKQARWEVAVKNYQSAFALRTNDVDARFNLDFAKQKVAEVREMMRLREEARQAKERADEAVRRRSYRTALQMMEEQSQKNPAAKEFEDFIGKLRNIDAIANPGQP